MMRRLTLIAYDIADTRRLRRVHKVVRDFADPLQYSVFLGALSRKDVCLLEAKLLDIINQARDQVMFVDLGPEPTHANPLPPGRFLGRKPNSLTQEMLVF